MKHKLKKLKNDQQGVATIVIAILIVLILTLVVLAMARNATREQRQALDRQLNSQAFYAAESGVNDTVEYAATNASVPEQKDDCAQDSNGFPSEARLDDNGPIEYSCVLYDKTPTTLQKKVGTDKSWVVPISSSTGISSLKLAWNEEGASSIDCSSTSATNFPTSANYPPGCSAGFLRAELIDPRGPTLNRDTLINNNFVAFFVPGDGSSPNTVGFGAGRGGADERNQGVVVRNRCNPSLSPKCEITITGLNLGANEKMFLRLRSIYKSNVVNISATSPGGDEVQFRGAQMMIDSTGKANDILKRIRVMFPLYAQSQYEYPEFAVQTNDSICKVLNVLPNSTGSNRGECPLP